MEHVTKRNLEMQVEDIIELLNSMPDGSEACLDCFEVMIGGAPCFCERENGDDDGDSMEEDLDNED